MNPEIIVCIVGLVALLGYIFYKEYVEYSKNHMMRRNANEINDIYKTMINEKNMGDISELSTDQMIQHHLEMYMLYHDGIEDKYDRNGQKIKGVHPNPTQALYHIQKAIDLGYTKGHILVGKLYQFGIHNFPIDLEKAKECYKHIVDNQLEYADNAVYNLQLIANQESSKKDNYIMKWLNIPIGHRIVTPKHVIEEEKIKNDSIKIVREEHSDDPDQPQERVLKNDIVTDTQNVHDHTLIKTVNESILKLKKGTELTVPMEDTLKDLRTHIESKTTNDKKTDALKTLDTIERNHQELIAFKMKEVDLLHLLWNRIVNNHKDKPDLKDNVYDQLADSVEHDNVVCSTGRFTRLLDSLNVVDDNVHIKSRALINRELMDKSSMIRAEMREKCTPSEQKDLDSPNDTPFSFEFTERMKNRIRKDFYMDYVKTNVLTQDELDTELNVWINYL
jgi:hypothetical protein